MGLKVYKYRGQTYQFDEDHVPDGAVLVEAKVKPVPANKARKPPANKSREVKHGSKASSNS